MAELAASQGIVWTGRVMSALVVVALVADAAVDLLAPSMISAEMEASGFPPNLAPVIGVIILVCALLYLFRRTAVLGAILTTGFLGGAICTHLRLGEIGSPPQLICILLGVLTWGALYFRDPRIRALLPLSA